MSRPNRTSGRILSVFLAVALSCWAGAARADSASEARSRYERAVKLYEDGVFDAALVEFTRAYELNPSFKLLYNIGQVRVAMQDYAGAVEAFQQYLRDGGREIPEARLASVQKELARLEQRVARIAVQTDIEGAEILVDDLVIGVAPLHGPALVNSGVRRVTVRHPAYLSQTQRVSLAGGEQLRVTLNLAGPAAAVTAAPAAPPAQQPVDAAPPSAPPSRDAAQLGLTREEFTPAAAPAEKRRNTLVAATWSATGAIALSALGVGVATIVKNGSLDDLRKERIDNRPNKFEDEAQKVDRLALATDVLIGTAVVAAGVSLWLTLRGRSERADARARVSFHPRGLGLSTEF